MSNWNAELTRKTRAAYLAVKELSNADAASVLGKSLNTVRAYRKTYPETAPEIATTAPPKAKTNRPGVIVLEMPMAEPSRSSSVGSVPVMRVSLPAPPWGGGFERNGVRA